jgi:predicted transposase YbfD/YdcC
LHKEGIVIAQEEVGEKTNEIPVVREFIDHLDIKGSVVTMDALHAQRDTVEYFVKKKEG